MNNNPPFSSQNHHQEEQKQENEEGYLGKATNLAYGSFDFFLKKSVTVIDKSGELIQGVGNTLQNSLDQTGITENVSYYTNKAAETTTAVGGSIYEKSSNAITTATSNEYVSDISTKSKEAIGTVGGAITGVGSVFTYYLTFIVIVPPIQNFVS